MPKRIQWRCFHCAKVCKTEAAARAHFGTSIYANPACTYSDAALREMIAELARYREEDTDLHRQIAGMQCAHRTDRQRAEEQGYERGLAEYRDVMPLLERLRAREHNPFEGDNQSALYRDIVAMQKRLGA